MPEADVFVRLCGPCQIDHTSWIRKHGGVEDLHGIVEKLVFNSIIPVHSINQSNLTVLS